MIHKSSSLDNVAFGDGLKVSKFCSIFGSPDCHLRIGKDCYIGMFVLINGFSASVTIGDNVSIAPRVSILSDSGPNASEEMQMKYPIEVGEVHIGANTWIGHGALILPGTIIGAHSVIAANAIVQGVFPEQSTIIGVRKV